MANGKPGDHPLTDILVHGLEVYGREADDLIRKIAELSSDRELNDWWDDQIGWSCEPAELLRRAGARHEELLRRARERGWETDD